jgi:hypothetical protein
MKPLRTAEQQIEQLDYIGDMVRQLARMASDDNQNLLTYILSTAAYEIEDQKRIKRSAMASNDAGLDNRNDASRTALNTTSQFKLK